VKAHQDLILEPLSWVAKYNGWPNYKFKFKNALNSSASAAAESMNTGSAAPSKNPLKESDQQAS
jgi:hypothetical protein